jgi:hypothetical protein
LRGGLPAWARDPLRLMGLTAMEVDGFLGGRFEADQQAADEVGRELHQLDREIEELEDRLLTMPCSSLEKIQAVLDLALTILRSQTVNDLSAVCYDHDNTRVLAFVEAAAEGVRSLLAADYRLAS